MAATRLVNTVLGPIEPEALGLTLMHEHVYIGWPGWDKDSTVRFDREGLIERGARALDELKQVGVQSFVDPCPMDLGRDPLLLAEVSRRSGMNVICATGLYYERLGIPTYFRLRSVDELADLFVHELTVGIGDTGGRAGIIKCATGLDVIGKHEEKVLRAAARASRRTGAPITTHTEGGTMGPEQVAIFASEGLPLERVIIGHSCGNSDLRYHTRMLSQGANLGFDRIGIALLMPDAIRFACLVGLLGLGYANQIVLSQNHVECELGRPRRQSDDEKEMAANRRFTYLFTDFLPRLRAAGIGEDTIRQMLVENPRRLFAGA